MKARIIPPIQPSDKRTPEEITEDLRRAKAMMAGFTGFIAMLNSKYYQQEANHEK